MSLLTGVVISDTHNYGYPLEKLPNADFLAHTGDATMQGSHTEYASHANWLQAASHKYKHVFYVPGNHDKCFDNDTNEDIARTMTAHLPNVHVLTNHAVTIEPGFKVYGFCYTKPIGWPWYYYADEGKMEETLHRVAKYQQKTIDLLLTHDPPYKVGDRVNNNWHHWPYVGSKSIREFVEMTEPAAHVFGHIHEGYGIYEGRDTGLTDRYDQPLDTVFINASFRDEQYHRSNSPWLLTFTKVDDEWMLAGTDRTVDL